MGVDRSAETLLPVTLPHEGGRGEPRRGSILLKVFFIFSLSYKHVKRRVLTRIHI